MSTFINNLNRRALQHVNDLEQIRMSRTCFRRYVRERPGADLYPSHDDCSETVYYGIGKTTPVFLDLSAHGIEFDLTGENNGNQEKISN